MQFIQKMIQEQELIKSQNVTDMSKTSCYKFNMTQKMMKPNQLLLMIASNQR